jgi:hypothetical protein
VEQGELFAESRPPAAREGGRERVRVSVMRGAGERDERRG